MGNIYIEGEERRRDVIASFPNNKIISFPQSIDFENTDIGKKEFEKSIEIYKNHNNLTIFSREEKSHNIMKSNFKNNVHLVPDTVIHLAGKIEANQEINREKILLCFRDDKEKVTSSKITFDFINLLKDHNFSDIEIIDTCLGNVSFKPNEKQEIFDHLLEKFYNSKIVITDRLHGMIFALITKTPCIAFDNSNKKISSTYNTWLKDVPYIKIYDDFEELPILNCMRDFSNLTQDDFEIDLSSNFEPLFNELEKCRN